MSLHPAVENFLTEHQIAHQAIDCDPALADTADFCRHYGYAPEQSANALLIASSKGEPRQAVCVVLAHCRLDVNRTARKKLGVRRLSFANPELTRELTGMELGGVTPFALPVNIPIWIDERVMACTEIVLGGGNRESKLVLPPQELLKVPGLEVVTDLAYEMTP
ncbi:MAG: hypothetical protein KTR33_00330 [Gammaproteobacteria bacterium]|nr:hypothetical protein [Gammaproteobacteria bacterium]